LIRITVEPDVRLGFPDPTRVALQFTRIDDIGTNRSSERSKRAADDLRPTLTVGRLYRDAGSLSEREVNPVPIFV
jgi:hypothetical protein